MPSSVKASMPLNQVLTPTCDSAGTSSSALWSSGSKCSVLGSISLNSCPSGMRGTSKGMGLNS